MSGGKPEVEVLCIQCMYCIIGWRPKREAAKPTRKEDLVDLASTFGISFGDDSDSSDAEFAPADDSMDSEG